MTAAISIENLWKEYRLGVIGHGTLTKDLQSWWARVRGKEDPNSIIRSGARREKQIEGDRFWALRGIDLLVKEGDALGIIGKNGAGKSTLLKILSRVTSPSRGCVRIKGRIASLLEVGTGFHPELTGRENIFMNGAILGMSKPEIRKKLDEIIDFSGVQDFIDTPVKRYSSGMRVRLGFAVAAHLDPEILVIDEVLAVGDAEFQKKCLGKMSSFAKGGRTVLFVSHNMNAISNLCKTCAFLDSGQLICVDEPGKVIERYLSVGADEGQTWVEFPENEQKDFQVLFAAIKTDTPENGRGIIQVDQPFRIEMKFKLGKKLPGAYGTFTIRNQREEVVLFSDSRDQGERGKLENPGRVEVSINVPMPLLVPGKYSLSVAIAQQGRGAIDWHKNVVRFEIVDTKGLRSSRSGYIYMPLKWSLNTQ